MTIASGEPHAKPWWRRYPALVAVGAALAVIVAVAGVWTVSRVATRGFCATLPDSDRARIERALSSFEVPDEQRDLGVDCLYGEFVAVRTYTDSATAADEIERSLLDSGWLPTPSRNTAFCLPGDPYLYAVIVPPESGTWRGDGVGSVELHQSASRGDGPGCPR